MQNQAINPAEPVNGIDILTIENFDDFAAGNSGGFSLEPGAYDAIVVGHTIVRTEFEDKISHRLQLLWQLKDEEGKTHNIRGNAWTISCNEKATMRLELQQWFNTADWGVVVDYLEKGGMLIKDEATGQGKFNPDGFLGKKARLLIADKKSKKGKTFSVVAGISPFKKKTLQIEFAEVPWFYVNDEHVLKYTLMNGIKVGEKKEKKGEESPNYTSTQQFNGQWVGNEPANGGVPQQQVGQSNTMLAANKGVTGAPMNNVDAQAYFNPANAPLQAGDLASQLPPDASDDVDLPF